MSEPFIRWGVPGNTKALQLQASNPASSAWVSAHAGSGKTFVLSQRVVRLLLEGVPPSKILCLTFTKAAAANMSLRVFDILSQWTRMDDAQLRAAIVAMGGDPGRLSLARRLFARAVETPGGCFIGPRNAVPGVLVARSHHNQGFLQPLRQCSEVRVV